MRCVRVANRSSDARQTSRDSRCGFAFYGGAKHRNVSLAPSPKLSEMSGESVCTLRVLCTQRNASAKPTNAPILLSDSLNVLDISSPRAQQHQQTVPASVWLCVAGDDGCGCNGLPLAPNDNLFRNEWPSSLFSGDWPTLHSLLSLVIVLSSIEDE